MAWRGGDIWRLEFGFFMYDGEIKLLDLCTHGESYPIAWKITRKMLSNLSNCDTSVTFCRYVDQTLGNTNHLLDIENIQYGG